MKKIVFLFLLFAMCLKSQNLYNNYQDFTGTYFYNNSGYPHAGFFPPTYLPFYNGEYMVNPSMSPISYFHWNSSTFAGQFKYSHKIESVSFPFFPVLPSPDIYTRDLNIMLNTGLTELTLENDLGDGFASLGDITLASAWFKDFVSSPPPSSAYSTYFPHTILKHTVYLHLDNGNTNCENPIIDSIIFIADHTRGRMREYPWAVNNSNSASAGDYDLIITPLLQLKSDYCSTDHSFNYVNNQPPLNLNYDVINYFPIEEINNAYYIGNYYDAGASTGNCSGQANAYVHPAPYSLSGFTICGAKAFAPAGYDAPSGGPLQKIGNMPQPQHHYTIDKSFDLKIINPREKVIYNPSEVDINITGTNTTLTFPSGYTFKSVYGIYPSESDINAADPNSMYKDKRKVNVSNANTFPENPSAAMSHYYVKSGNTLLIEPCVTILDATIHVEAGATLDYNPSLSAVIM